MFASVLVAALMFGARYLTDQHRLPRRADRTAQTEPASKIDWNQVNSPASQGPQEITVNLPAEPISQQTSVPNQLPERNPETFSAPAFDTNKVIGIVDGDTVDVLVDNRPLRLRLNGIDTPEKGQPFGNNATDDLGTLIAGKQVRFIVKDTDRYDRSIADIYLGDLYVNQWLVERGLAWHYVAYSNDQELAKAQQRAESQGIGLWSDPRRVAPWNWRKLSKLERDNFR